MVMERPESGVQSSDIAKHPTRLTQDELADHWRVSPRTLERWRVVRTGPAWIKLNGRVIYRLEDVLAFEQAQRQSPEG